MNILLLGKTGLVGNAIFRVFSPLHHVTAPSHEECDVTRFQDLKKNFECAPELVINATGFTNVDLAETERENAFRLNREVVENLVELAAAKNIPLVHFSTDYVFDGSKKIGYEESDLPNPGNTYGASKAAGEKALEAYNKVYLIRTQWLYGEGGKNFVSTLLELASVGTSPMKVVADQVGCPTFTLDFAQALLHVLQERPYGIYHIVNGGACSWYEFAAEIFSLLGYPQKILPVTTEEFGRRANRPHHSILKNTKLPALRHWKEALEQYLQPQIFLLPA